MGKKIYSDAVKVGGVSYQVAEVPFVEISGDKNYGGSCDYQKCEIKLLASMSDERKNQIFAHELTHAILNEAGYDEHDEDMVNRMGIVLHQVLVDNEFES